MKNCHTHTHRTFAILEGEQTLIYNWSCLPHGIWRKAYGSQEARDKAMKEHMKKKLKELNSP